MFYGADINCLASHSCRSCKYNSLYKDHTLILGYSQYLSKKKKKNPVLRFIADMTGRDDLHADFLRPEASGGVHTASEPFEP